MERLTLFADILLPLPLKGLFTYRVPQSLNEQIRVGQRAVVQFGSRKVYAGLVRNVHTQPPRDFQAKYILSLLDDEPVVKEDQFLFWEWIANYYLCTLGEVMNAALPPAMKLSGETKILLHPQADLETEEISEKEFALLQALKNKKEMSLSEASGIAGLPKVLPLLKGMIEKGMIVMQDSLDDPWQPRTETLVKLTTEYAIEEKLKEVFDQTERKAPRQLELLISFIRLSRRYEPHPAEVLQKELTATVKGGPAALKALIGKGVFETYTQQVSHFSHQDAKKDMVVFNEHQEAAWKEINQSFQHHDITLLHGVTSSGKTEIYIKLIREYIEQGMQVLYLLPEIALTAQIINRLQRHFGDRAGVYHSRFSAGERIEVWNNLLLGGIVSHNKVIRYDLVLGPRSAMFLPYSKLGLIIVDEEHEPSFKQHDPAPRYQARDAAIYLARMHGAKVLLGSATPSLETFFNAQTGKFGYVDLNHRHGGVKMPEIIVADLRQESRNRKMKSHFSSMLYESIQTALANKEQVILFQNRRGFSPRLECEACNWIPECKQCDVSLVYHKKINKLKCHYCGYTITQPSNCPVCNSTNLRLKGFGTEKIEEELPVFFPEATNSRMDLDTTRSKNAYSSIINDFEERRIDILVGTQMVSKGLDFNNVSVVGILNADNMLNFPDFRAHERAFQLMAQVSGRAGRDQKRGKVIIQTWNPQNTIIKQVVANDYESMYHTQIMERQRFHYPPFFRLIRVTVLHRDASVVNQAADELSQRLRKHFPKKVLGPEYPPVSRIRNQYMKNMMVKLERDAKLSASKDKLSEIVDFFLADPAFKRIRVILDVDPA
ncbi:MAG: primosomal protein N' [Bacteroides sp.]|jgi:primosomal protein N' (replication factor Y)|nr:primosomal protein N' [Bacteroides sp.]